MEKYKNEEQLKNTIMGQSRHLFIYGYDTDYRSEFLQSLEKDYPVIADSNKPVALYFDSLGMPKLDINLKDKDSYLIHAICREYLSFTIATKILEKTLELNMFLDDRLSRLLYLINRTKNNSHASIKTVEDLLKEIKTSRDFYYKNYINYVKGRVERIPIDEISIPFIQLDMFVSNYKTGMNIDSYLGIIFDKKGKQTTSSIQAINDLIARRINKDISVKVAIEPENWETYRDANGQLIEATHDYGIVELDDSLKDNIKKMKKSFY